MAKETYYVARNNAAPITGTKSSSSAKTKTFFFKNKNKNKNSSSAKKKPKAAPQQKKNEKKQPLRASLMRKKQCLAETCFQQVVFVSEKQI